MDHFLDAEIIRETEVVEIGRGRKRKIKQDTKRVEVVKRGGAIKEAAFPDAAKRESGPPTRKHLHCAPRFLFPLQRMAGDSRMIRLSTQMRTRSPFDIEPEDVRRNNFYIKEKKKRREERRIVRFVNISRQEFLTINIVSSHEEASCEEGSIQQLTFSSAFLFFFSFHGEREFERGPVLDTNSADTVPVHNHECTPPSEWGFH